MYKTDMDRQAAKFKPEGDRELALKVFKAVWPEKYRDGELVWKMSDRTLTYNGKVFKLVLKKQKIGRDDRGLKHEIRRSLEVFNMLLTLRLPIYACLEFRQRVRAVQDARGSKFLSALVRLEDFAASLPEAEHSAKWGYANALLGEPVNKLVTKEKK